MDLLSYLRVLRRRWIIILAGVLVGAVLGAGSTFLDGDAGQSGRPHYKAAHTLVLEISEADTSGALTNLDQMALLVTAGDVPDRVGERLDRNGPRSAHRITTLTSHTTSTLEIVAIDIDGRAAEVLADTYADELVAEIDEKEQERFNQVTEETTARLDGLEANVAELDAQLAVDPGNEVLAAQREGLVAQYQSAFERFQEFSAAGPPTSNLETLEGSTAIPITAGTYTTLLERAQRGENHVRIDTLGEDGVDPTRETAVAQGFQGPVSRGVLGGFLGLLAAIGLALIIDRYDRRLRTREEVEAAFGLPVLAEVPSSTPDQQRRAEVLTHSEPLSRVADAYRAVRASLLFQSMDAADRPAGVEGNGEGAPPPRKPLVIMVTSAAPQDGKTTTSVNLAAAFAETGDWVLVINCDFRRPMAHKFLGVPDEPARTLKTDIEGVMLVSSVMPKPTRNPAQIITAQQQVIAKVRDRYDVVILDTAPLLTANDAVELVSLTDLVVLVAKGQGTTSDAALRSTNMLRRLDAPLAGVVTIGTRPVSDEYYYYSYEGAAGRDLAHSTRGRPRGDAPAVSKPSG